MLTKSLLVFVLSIVQLNAQLTLPLADMIAAPLEIVKDTPNEFAFKSNSEPLVIENEGYDMNGNKYYEKQVVQSSFGGSVLGNDQNVEHRGLLAKLFKPSESIHNLDRLMGPRSRANQMDRQQHLLADTMMNTVVPLMNSMTPLMDRIMNSNNLGMPSRQSQMHPLSSIGKMNRNRDEVMSKKPNLFDLIMPSMRDMYQSEPIVIEKVGYDENGNKFYEKRTISSSFGTSNSLFDGDQEISHFMPPRRIEFGPMFDETSFDYMLPIMPLRNINQMDYLSPSIMFQPDYDWHSMTSIEPSTSVIDFSFDLPVMPLNSMPSPMQMHMMPSIDEPSRDLHHLKKFMNPVKQSPFLNQMLDYYTRKPMPEPFYKPANKRPHMPPHPKMNVEPESQMTVIMPESSVMDEVVRNKEKPIEPIVKPDMQMDKIMNDENENKILTETVILDKINHSHDSQSSEEQSPLA